MKKILFVTYGGGHVNIVIPIVREIEKHNNMDYKILALTTAIPNLENSGLKYKTLLDYLPMLQNNNEIINIGNKLACQYHNSDAGFSIEQTSAYLGCSMHDLIKKVGEEKAFEKFEAEGRKAFCPTSIMKQILKIEKPDIVVTTVPYRMEKAAVLEAKKLGIKTVFIHDWYYIQKNKLYNNVDIHFVMNDIAKKELVSYGIDKNKICITGQPAFDYLLQPFDDSLTEIYQDIGINIGMKNLVWFVDNSTALNPREIQEVEKAVRYFKNYNFIIKLHPNEENIEKFMNIFNKYSNVKVLHKYDNRKLLEIGEVFLVGKSTMALEVSFFEKDLILMDFDNIDSEYNRKYRPDRFNLAIPALENDNLISTMEMLLKNDNVKLYLKKAQNKFFLNKEYASIKCYEILKTL